MSPKLRGAVAFQLSLLAGSAVLGAVLLLIFFTVGGYENLLVRGLIIGFVVGPGSQVVIQFAERMRAKAVQDGEPT